MDAEADDDSIDEVEVAFVPRSQVLAALGIPFETFEAILLGTLAGWQDRAARGEAIPPLEETPLKIEGVTYKLSDLAEVELRAWRASP